MATRAEWLAANRAYIGSPFLHQGRTRNGMDCVGLLSCAANDIGMPNAVHRTLKDYERAPDSDMFKLRIKDFLLPLPYNRLQPLWTQILPGDVIAFWVDRRGLPRHVAVYTGVNSANQTMILHSHAKAPRRVVEQPMDSGFWLKRIDSLWRLPELEG